MTSFVELVSIVTRGTCDGRAGPGVWVSHFEKMAKLRLAKELDFCGVVDPERVDISPCLRSHGLT